MNKKLIALYRECRKHKPFMLVGSDAECSLSAARTILEFRRLEDEGLVRMRSEIDEDYTIDFDKPDRNGHEMPEKEWEQQKREWYEEGIYGTISEWFDGDEWQNADFCWGHVGYKDPLDPFENCYVVQEMQAAIDGLTQHRQTIEETELAEVWP